jgi:hypothetical protein
MPENTKSALKSKTVWVSLLTLAAGIITLISGNDLIAEYPQVVSVLAMVSGGIGVVLRVLTNTAIK